MSEQKITYVPPVFKALQEEVSAGRDTVLSTVVNTWGSTPQKPGARLLVRKDGTGIGTLGGGCVEGDIWFTSLEILKRGGQSQWQDYTLNEDLAAQDGLVCGGTMRFLIQPIENNSYFTKFTDEVIKAAKGGKPVAIATIVKANNNIDTVGKSMLIRENSETVGTLFDSERDQVIIKKALNLMAMGKQEYIVDRGTKSEVYIEAWTTPPTLILTGGGHVSKAISLIANSVGMRVFVFDDRKEFSNPQRFPNAQGTFTGSYTEPFSNMHINANSFIVIATRGHKYDADATNAALDTNASYVGLLGSRRKSVLVFEELLKRGRPFEDVSRVRSPIGLDIGARTPEEIAISVIAEILKHRFNGTGMPMMSNNRMLLKAKERADRSEKMLTTKHIV